MSCPHNMVNFGLLTAEIHPVVSGTLQISTGFASWQRCCTASSSGRQPNFAALNRGRHLCSAGRPSRWAHSSNFYCLIETEGLLKVTDSHVHVCKSGNISGRTNDVIEVVSLRRDDALTVDNDVIKIMYV